MDSYSRYSYPPEPEHLIGLHNLFEGNILSQFDLAGNTPYIGNVMDIRGNHSVIFADQNLVRLVLRLNPTTMHVDKSFKMVPARPRSTHLLTIHFEINNYSFPVIYSLMEADVIESYHEVFNFIKQFILPNYCPRQIFSEISLTIMIPLLLYFRTAEYINGSWFQYNQNLWEKVMTFGYLDFVMRCPAAFQCLKMLMLLPLLPSPRIEEGFREVKSYSARRNINLSRLFDYYNWYWLDQYGSDNISVYQLPLKTNNNIQKFHKMFSDCFQTTPTIWAFLGVMCTFNKSYITIGWQLNRGEIPDTDFIFQFSNNQHRIVLNTSRLMTGDINILDFLHRCSPSLNNYQRYLQSSAMKIFYHNVNINNVPRVISYGNGTDDNREVIPSNIINVTREDRNYNSLHRQRQQQIQLEQQQQQQHPLHHYQLHYRQQQLFRRQQQLLQQQQLIQQQQQLQQQLLFLQQQQDEQRYRNESNDHHEDERRVLNHHSDNNDDERSVIVITDSESGSDSDSNNPDETNEATVDSSDSDDQSTHGFCMVCHTKKYHHKFIILPCGHSWICRRCRNKKITLCPYCRNRIDSFTQILETTI